MVKAYGPFEMLEMQRSAAKCSEVQRSAAKCWLNAGKFFPDVVEFLYKYIVI